MSAKLEPKTALERNAARWLNSQATAYDNGIEGALGDLYRGGCQSGVVGHLIYYADTLPFFRKHRKEIEGILKEYTDNGVLESPADLKGWDTSDPFARETQNQNLLAWFGFEEAARAIAERAGIEV